MLRPLVAASLALLLAPTLRAQRADVSTVPKELVQALLTFEGISAKAPSVVVGELPEPKLAKLVPQASTVLGGVIPGLYMGASSVTVLSRRDVPDSAMRVMRDHLERLGLRAAPEGWFGGGGGFAPSAPELTNNLQFCGDSLLVTIKALARTGGGSLVKLGHRSGSLTNTICDRELLRRGRRPEFEEIPVPSLRAPPGAIGGGTGGSRGTDHREVTTRLESNLSAPEIVAHYAAQMQQAGWVLGNRVAEGDAALQTMRRTDEKGVLLFAVLSDARLERHHDVSLRVTILSKRD